jgi:hypothetical protein
LKAGLEIGFSREPPPPRTVCLHGNQTRTLLVVSSDGSFRHGGSPGAAECDHTSGADRAAFGFARRQLRADAAIAEFRRGGA